MWTCVKLSLLLVKVDTAAIFIELLKLFKCYYFFGCMCMSVDVSGAQLTGWREGGPPLSFFENLKNFPNNLEKWFYCVHL